MCVGAMRNQSESALKEMVNYQCFSFVLKAPCLLVLCTHILHLFSAVHFVLSAAFESTGDCSITLNDSPACVTLSLPM